MSEETEPPKEEETEETEDALEQLLDGLSIESASSYWRPDTIVFYGQDSRSVLISGEVTETLSNAICSQLRQLSKDDPEGLISVYINTEGGSVFEGLAIYDVMRAIPNPIVTIASGTCMSAGLFLLAAGDVRLAYEHTMFFYHLPITDRVSIYSQETYDNARTVWKWCEESMNKILRQTTGMSKKKWKKHFGDKHNKYFTAKQALKYGLINKIFEPAKKPVVELAEDKKDG